jgi:hypothetical protein
MANQEYPMPGQTDFTADEEQQMRNGQAAATGPNASQLIGSATLSKRNAATGEETILPSEPLYGHQIPRSKF